MENPSCQHHKFGFCKFKNHCQKQHMEEKCQDLAACRNIKLCNKRHPKVCKRYVLERFCKFGMECSYAHIITASDQNNSLEAKKIEVLENNEKVLQERVKHLEEGLRTLKQKLEEKFKGKSKEKHIDGKKNDKDDKDLQKCTECDYQCERKMSLIKHVNTKHRKSLKFDQCGDIIQDNNAMEAHMKRDHSEKRLDKTQPSSETIEKVSGVVIKNVKCDECNSDFTSKMALSQHMFTTHTPTRIEDTGIFCNLCGEEFWKELDMVHHLNDHMKGYKTDEPFFCKLCGIGLTEKDAINKHMISHIENVLKEDMDAKASINAVVEKLATISETEHEPESEEELDEDEDLESFMKEFDQDGNRIFLK